MAPEMFKQELPTPAVDIYALGVTLYQMLSGATPFEGTTPVQLMYLHLNEPVPSIEAVREDIPAVVQIVLDKDMAKRPEDRFATAGEPAGALRRSAQSDTLETMILPSPPVPTQAAAAKAKPTAKEWLLHNWRILLSLVNVFITVRWLTDPGPSFILAWVGALILMGTLIRARHWKWMTLWLIFPFCGLLSLAVETAEEGGPGILPRLLLLEFAITGLVVDMRVNSQVRKQTKPGGQTDTHSNP